MSKNTNYLQKILVKLERTVGGIIQALTLMVEKCEIPTNGWYLRGE